MDTISQDAAGVENKPKILVIDSRPGSISNILSDLAIDADFIEGDYSAATLRKMVKFPLSLILFDVVIDADIVREFLEWMEQEEAVKSIPVILISEDPDHTAMLADGMGLDALDIIEKPLEPRPLGRRLSQILQIQHGKALAENANRTKSDFLASISHEIRTPLGGIIGMAELLLKTELTENQNQRMQTLLFAGKTLVHLVNDLLDISKIENNQMELENTSFDLKLLCEEVTDVLAIRAYEKQLECILRYSREAPRYVIGDPHRIKQILYNLIGNAIKFTDHGYVQIKVVGAENGDGLTFEFVVEDTGIGIERSKLQSIFSAYTQAEASTSRNFGGTGLGLSITQKLTELMGGELAVSSKLGEGSSFSATINLKPDNSKTEQAEEAQPKSLHGLNILIVDDSRMYAEYCSEVLSAIGVQTNSVNSGEAAIQELERAMRANEPYDVALIDYMMPCMDGPEVAHAIKERELINRTPLILVTAYPRKGMEKELQAEGFSGYLSKPFREDTLARLMETVWEKKQSQELGQGEERFIDHEDDTVKGVSDAADFKGAKVLLVDDNKTNRLVAEMALKEVGCQVTMVENGQEALDALVQDEYRLIFMDCDMPVMDGFEASREIRLRMKEGRYPSSPIIAFTSNVVKKQISKCAKAGMNDYIAKPFREDDLKIMLAKWL